jgi:PAS domain S-box-containing protein
MMLIRLLREMIPHYETFWYEIFGRVARTGLAERMQKFAEPDQKWYDFYVFKIGQKGNHIAVIFQDITERARREINQAFLAKITHDLSRLSTSEEIMETVGSKIGEYLNVKSCLFVDVYDEQGEVTVFDAWSSPEVKSLRHQKIRLSDFISEEFSQANRNGDSVVVRDTHIDPRGEGKDYSSVGIGAFVTVPFHRQGIWTNYLAITNPEPRDWQDDEIELFRELANRIFPRLERARAEENLHQLEDRTRIAIEAAEMATWEWNLVTDQIYWNEQHYRLLGIELCTDSFDTSEVLNRPQLSSDFLKYLHPDDVARITADLTRAIEQKGVYDADFRIIRTDGTTRWMSGYGRITGESEGKATRFSGVMFDINERKQAEEALLTANRNKDEFLATLAHELRNPLAPIRNLLQILHLTANDNKTINSAVTMMNRQVDQLVRLVDDLLDVSRISRGKVLLQRERIDFNEVVQQVVETTRPIYDAVGRALTVTLPDFPLYMQGDNTRLAQVINNLLNNAAKFTHDGGAVALTLENDGTEAVLTVHDNGIGIVEQDLERIFELFVQSDTSLEKTHGGLGLGLTLVRQLVELHGGRITAHSEGHNRGSAFTVHLPLLNESYKTQPMEHNIKSASDVRRILVVDDNVDAAFTLQMLLKLKGFHTDVRYGGQEAIEAAESLAPEVILMDISMPGMSGYDACRLIRQQPWGKTIVIVALTGFGKEEDRQLSKEAGFDGHLVKPVDLQTLLDLLSSLLAV